MKEPSKDLSEKILQQIKNSDGDHPRYVVPISPKRWIFILTVTALVLSQLYLGASLVNQGGVDLLSLMACFLLVAGGVAFIFFRSMLKKR